MNYKTFGKTGIQVSALGFGCMRFPVIGKDNSRIDEKKSIKMIHHAIEKGVNYFDTAYPYHGLDFSQGGSSEPFLAKALSKGYREKVHIATKLPCWLVETKNDMDRLLNEQLERLETDHVDFYLLHSLNKSVWDKLLGFGVLEFLDEAIRKGRIGYAGFSYHDEIDPFKEITDAYDWSFCQILYNYYDEYNQAGREGLNYAIERDIAVVSMEPLRGGSLVTGLPDEARKVLKEADPQRSELEWALLWLWNQPEVSVVLSGMSTLDQVKENLSLAEDYPSIKWTPEDDKAVSEAYAHIKKLERVGCTACNYCMPCPDGVNIPRNFALCNDHHMLKDPGARFRYNGLLGENERASNCSECGQCEEHCPQHIAIREELKHVAELFS